jgi:hypothetical protein
MSLIRLELAKRCYAIAKYEYLQLVEALNVVEILQAVRLDFQALDGVLSDEGMAWNRVAIYTSN